MADIIIVGAGLSGLIAARALVASEKKPAVQVVEASDHSGGRMLRQQISVGDDNWVDVGGQWAGRTQENLKKLASGLKINLFPQWKTGETRLSYGGRVQNAVEFRGYPGPTEKLAIQAKALQDELESMQVDRQAPWTAIPEWDDQNFAQWLKQKPAYAAFWVAWNSRFNQSGGSPQEVSLLHTLFELSASPFEDDPDESLFTGGAGQIPGRLEQELQQVVKFHHQRKVVALHQEKGRVKVTAVGPDGTAASLDADRVIVAVPPFLTSSISFVPTLSARRLQLVQRMPMGVLAKICCVYNAPWWRAQGLSGSAVGDDRTIVQQVEDSGPVTDPKYGVLAAFIQGPQYIKWRAMEEEKRNAVIVEDLIHFFGEKAKSELVQIIIKDWPAEPLTGGAYNAYLPPGAWTLYGSEIRKPHDRIHWAGTETADRWYGYFEGAIIAGERAAHEVLALI